MTEGEEEKPDNDQQELLDALKEHYPEEAPAGFDISEGDLPSSASVAGFANVSFQPIPDLSQPAAAPGDPVPEFDPFAAPAAEADALLRAEEAALAGESAVPGDENPDAAGAVDGMLSAAVVPDDALLADLDLGEIPEAGLSTLTSPSFQLQVQVEPAQFPLLREIAVAEGLSFSNSTVFSQLSEFQAVSLRMRALAQGWSVKTTVKFPMPALSEEETALGDLASVPDAADLVAEGAPAVTLPKSEKEVMLFSASKPGVSIQETLGIVTAHRSIARRFFREEEAQEKLVRELARVPGKTASLPASRLDALFRELFLDLQKSALARGGNCVLGIRLEAFPETSSMDPALEQLRLVAFGTAAVVEKAESPSSN